MHRTLTFSAVCYFVAFVVFAAAASFVSPAVAAAEDASGSGSAKVRVKTKNLNAGDQLKIRVRNIPDHANRLGVLLCPNIEGQTTTGCAILHEVPINGRTTLRTTFELPGTIDEGFGITNCAATPNACSLWFLAGPNGGINVQKRITFAS